MQARTETKDYSAKKKTKGEHRESQERGARRAPSICFLYRPLPPIARSLTRAKDCGVVLSAAANHDTSSSRRRLPHKRSLCATKYPVPHSHGVTRCHVGPMALAESLLAHAQRMDADCLPEHLH